MKSLAEYGGEDFILVECFRFDKWTDEELWLRETYRVELDYATMDISGQEIRDFYGERYPLDREFIEKSGTRHAAECKWLRSHGDLLNPSMVPELLIKGNELEYGRSLSFRIRHHFQWFVRIHREADDSYLPYKYGMKAVCLDNPQSIGRRYTSFDDALLRCLNHFNENAGIPDRYESINDYLSKHNCL